MKISEIISNDTKPSSIGKYLTEEGSCAWGAVLEFNVPGINFENSKDFDLYRFFLDKHKENIELDKINEVLFLNNISERFTIEHDIFGDSFSYLSLYELVVRLNDKLKLNKKQIGTILEQLGF